MFVTLPAHLRQSLLRGPGLYQSQSIRCETVSVTFTQLHSHCRADDCTAQALQSLCKKIPRSSSTNGLSLYSVPRNTCSCPWGDAGSDGVFSMPSPHSTWEDQARNVLITPDLSSSLFCSCGSSTPCDADHFDLPITCSKPGNVFILTTANEFLWRGVTLSQ